MKLLWLTDLHLNFTVGPLSNYFESLALKGDALVISGDTAEAPTVVDYLTFTARAFGKPIYFVLGNHDYYHGSFSQVHNGVSNLQEPNLHWLTNKVYELTPNTAIVGHDGWYDAQEGSPYESRVLMSDWEVIEELKGVHWIRSELVNFLRQKGLQCALEAKESLGQALEKYKNVIFVTHYPPFLEASWHNGQNSDNHWAPWFTWKAMGAVLLKLAKENKHRKIKVLCGHTHSPGIYKPTQNLEVVTGAAHYGVLKEPKLWNIK